MNLEKMLKVKKSDIYLGNNVSGDRDYFYQRNNDILGLVNGYKPIATFYTPYAYFSWDDGPVIDFSELSDEEIVEHNRDFLLSYYLEKLNAKMIPIGKITEYNVKTKKIRTKPQTYIFYINPKYKNYAFIHKMMEEKTPQKIYDEFKEKEIEYFNCMRNYIDSTILGYLPSSTKKLIKRRVTENEYGIHNGYEESKMDFNTFYKKLSTDGNKLIKKWSSDKVFEQYDNLIEDYKVKWVETFHLDKLQEFIKKYKL